MARGLPWEQARRRATEEHWIPLSDLMTGLMMIFMLISVILVARVEAHGSAAQTIAERYDAVRHDLYQDLSREFSPDLARWHARLTPDLTLRFDRQNLLFATGSADLRPDFRATLDAFFPRYIRILTDPKYRDSVSEIRIEGHTSSVWGGSRSADEAYFRNMELSQSRTRSTLQYVLLLPAVAGEKPWLVAKLTANGLSSAHALRNADGSENIEGSQRVEFRVRTDAEQRLDDLVRAVR